MTSATRPETPGRARSRRAQHDLPHCGQRAQQALQVAVGSGRVYRSSRNHPRRNTLTAPDRGDVKTADSRLHARGDRRAPVPVREKAQEPARQQAYGRWPEKVRFLSPTLPFIPPQVSAEALETVQSALLEDKQLAVRYQPMESVSIGVHPASARLVQRGRVTYLVVTAYDYNDARIYPLHRMRSAEILDERVRRQKTSTLIDTSAPVDSSSEAVRRSG